MKKTYRVEDTYEMGMWKSSLICWGTELYENNNPIANEIMKRFNEIETLRTEFPDYTPDMFCAFKDIHQAIKILPKHCLKFLVDKGLKVVEVQGKFIEGDTQLVFKKHEVKKKEITIDTLFRRAAKAQALQDLKSEFVTIKPTNYMIYE